VSEGSGAQRSKPDDLARPAGPRPPPARKRALFLAVSAAIAAAVVVTAHAVLLPFILGLVVAYVLTPAVLRLERLRVPRWAAILIVYIIALGSVGGFVALSVPRFMAEGKALAVEAPRLAARAREQWLPAIDERLRRWSGRDAVAPDRAPSGEPQPAVIPAPPPAPAADADRGQAAIRIEPRADGSFDVVLAEDVQLREKESGVWTLEQAGPRPAFSSATVLQGAFEKGSAYLRENSLTLLRIGQEIATAISRGIFTLFMTLMLGGYLILTHERILAFFRELWDPADRDSFDRFLRRLDRGLSGVVRGQLIICLVNGLLSAIGFWLFDLKYWPILAVVAAVMSLIPIFGSILSSVPAVIIGLTQSPATALGVLAWIVGIHQLEANFLNPKIIGDAAKIHPVLVVFSLLVGEHFFQIAGALFAVPCMSIAQTIFLHLRESALGLADPTASVPPPGRPSLRAPAAPPAPRVPSGLDFVRTPPAPTPIPAAATPLPATVEPKGADEPPGPEGARGDPDAAAE
jgi:predicted PurR-regulated permease PerM